MTIKESNGTHYDHNTGKQEPVYCTVNGCDCPYYEKGICYIANPVEDCDDFAMFFPTWKDWEDCY